MGRDFRAPRQTDKKAWAVVERLIANGFTFSARTGIRVPTELRDVPAFIRTWRRIAAEGELIAKREMA
jgi:hypothetical protein